MEPSYPPTDRQENNLPTANVITSTQSPQQPSVDFSQSTQPIVMSGQSPEINGSNIHFNPGLILVAAIVVIIVAAAALYFWLLPPYWANGYTKNIKPLYLQQSTQLTAVYNSLSNPLFNNANISQASNNKDIKIISDSIASGITDTNSLASKNNLTVLPGTSWQRQVSNANAEYQSMQIYISESRTFLLNYQKLITYMQSYEKIMTQYGNKIPQDFAAVSKATNAQGFISSIQTTIADIQGLTNQIKNLHPSTDVQAFNSNLISDISNMNGTLQGLVADVQSHNVSDLNQQLAILIASARSMDELLANSPTANLKNSSSLHDQYVLLQQSKPVLF